jgi:hypothetical protein
MLKVSRRDRVIRSCWLFCFIVLPLIILGCGQEPVDPLSPSSSQIAGSRVNSVSSYVLYGVESSTDGLSTIDPVSATVTFVGPLDPDPDVFRTPIAMAVRPSDRELFVWNNSGVTAPGALLTVDRCTGLASKVNPSTPPQGTLQALAFSPDGRLFGVEYSLFEIDPATGVKTLIGDLGSGLRVGGADFDAAGTLYGVGFGSGSQRLVTINTTTGATDVIVPLSVDIGTIGSIVFDPSGVLIGSAFDGPEGDILFDINPATGAVSNIRPTSASPPQGMGFALPCGQVALDIKPGSCPNPLNPKSKGVLPAAILGTADFDVTQIDAATLSLEGVPPIRSRVADVSTPVVGDPECDCTTEGPDGYYDLTLKFKTQDIVAAIGPVSAGDVLVLTITGSLLDGTPIEGSDCVRIVGNVQSGAEARHGPIPKD